LIYKPVSAATKENYVRDTTKYLLKNHELPWCSLKLSYAQEIFILVLAFTTTQQSTGKNSSDFFNYMHTYVLQAVINCVETANKHNILGGF